MFVVWVLGSCSSEAEMGGKIPPLPGLQKNRNKVAIDALTNALNNSPRSSEIYFKRAQLFMADGSTQAALEDVEKALDLRNDLGKYHLLRAQIKAKLGSINQAIESAEKAEVLDTETPDLYVLLGELNQSIKRYTKAETYLAKALQVTPRNAEAYYFKGLIAAKRFDTTTAVGQYQHSISLKSNFAPPYIRLVEIHNQLKAYPISFEYSKAGLRIVPKEPELWFLLGQAYQRNWRIDSAMICYRTALRHQPNHPKSNLSAGLIYFKQNDLIRALRHFETVLKTEPNTPQINFLIGQCMEYLGRFEEAKGFYEFALKQNAYDNKAQAGFWRVSNRLIQYTGIVNSARPTTPSNPQSIPLTKSVDSNLRVSQIPTIKHKTKPETKTDSLLRRRLVLPSRNN